MMHTLAEENYLKAICRLSGKGGKGVSTNDIARSLKTKASSVTDMAKRLADKELIAYRKYHGVRLTKEGKNVALRIMRKHRLWEVFLVEKLNFKWHEVHDIAEQLEHVNSAELTKRLDKFLGFPKYDPHGDPIPDAEGNIYDHEELLSLDALDAGESAVIIGVRESSAGFLRHLESKGLVLGTKVTVRERYGYDSSMLLAAGAKARITVTSLVSHNLYVRKLKA